MKTKALLALLFLLQFFLLSGQIHIELPKVNVDSLQKILPGLYDYEKVGALNKLSQALLVSNPDSSIGMANRSIALSEKLDYQKGLADGFFNLGNCYYVLDEFKPTINYYLKALELMKILIHQWKKVLWACNLVI